MRTPSQSMRSSCVATCLDNMTSSCASPIRLRLTRDMSHFEAREGFYRLLGRSRARLRNARFDTVAGADRIAVLRMHFRFDGKEYDATYRWQSDPDNYPRFTGYVYLADSKSPGLEALFPTHQ